MGLLYQGFALRWANGRPFGAHIRLIAIFLISHSVEPCQDLLKGPFGFLGNIPCEGF